MKDFEGRVAVVTGAASGIGLERGSWRLCGDEAHRGGNDGIALPRTRGNEYRSSLSLPESGQHQDLPVRTKSR